MQKIITVKFWALCLLILGLIYKTFVVKLPAGNSNKNAFFNLLLNIIFVYFCKMAHVKRTPITDTDMKE